MNPQKLYSVHVDKLPQNCAMCYYESLGKDGYSCVLLECIEQLGSKRTWKTHNNRLVNRAIFCPLREQDA